MMNEGIVKSMLKNPVKYAHLMGFDLLTDIHNEWIRSMITEKEDYTLLGHRGSYKTTCLSIAFAFMIVLKPDATIFFIRKTDTDVIEIVRQVKKILESDVMQYIVYELYGVELSFTSATSFKIDTNLNTMTRGQVQLQGMGLNGSLTGKHATYVFTDDIVNVKDRVSKAEREQTKLQYQELQNIKNRDGRIYNTGTPWAKDDCISTLMPNVHRYTVYDTGLIDKATQKHLRESMSASLYAANYELKHIADEDAMFDHVNWLDDTSDIYEIYDGRGHIDAAYGGADYTAYTILKKVNDDRFIGYGKLWAGHVDDHVEAIKALHEHYRAGSISCERNGDKGYLASELSDLGMYVNGYSEHMNKYVKIATYLRKNWNNIWWISDTDPEYLDQILDYTEFASHDDAPDSAASLLRNFEEEAYVNTDEILVGGII